ncbi:vacuolar protein sorting-associated protein 13 [Cubamyces lactineus]|nr:vacuolar protein sorting-associated protein 13 [Cubamyces lactineus]
MVWWSDPGKEVLNILFNRVLAPYVENLDMNQVNYGIGQGQITLTKLRLKKGALDKFRLPVDVIDAGHLGKLSLSLHWMNLGNQPVEVLVEDVYLLVVPSSESTYDPEEEERRAQDAKFERLENAELLHMQSRSDVSQDSAQSQGLLSSLVTKIINNLQVTVRNIHIRYEDKLSVPGHPFAAGATLAGFTAVSVNERWQPAFIDSKAGAVHKLARLESLAVYFDTDCQSLAGLSYQEFVEKFTALISKGNRLAPHQFILKPVSGEGKIIMNHKLDKETPRFDVQLSFDEIGVLLDDNQYRDAISLVDMYHFYTRQHQYQKYRPSAEEFEKNRPRALLKFATTAILDEVRDRRRRWTWEYFAERRDDRHRYVDLFKRKHLGPLPPQDVAMLEALERKLSYDDLRFYRSIARSQLRKDMATRRKLEEERKKKQPQKQTSWSSWIWGPSSSSTGEPAPSTEESAFTGEMTEEQRKELYAALDYDEKTALAEALDTPRDALKARVKAQLNRGSFALKTDPHGKNSEIISVVFDIFQATFLQRQDNFETSLSLGGFAVRDGTTPHTAYPLIVHVQEKRSQSEIVKTLPVEEPGSAPELADPFFFLKFEQNPLDGRADSALSVRMRYMEIVYHKGYIEAIYKFLKPPASQLESVEALLNVASQTLEGLRKETRIGLEYALQTHKTIDVQMDLNAPIIIVPEDVTTTKGKHLVIDAGHISIGSELASKEAIQEIHAKRRQQYTEEDYKHLESMMYDRLTVRLEAAQFLIGDDLDSCLKALRSKENDNLHLLERTNFDLQVQNSIVPTAYTLARFKVSGHLPALQVNMSDTKYKSLMRLIDVSIPHFDDPEQTPDRAYSAQRASTSQRHASTAFKIPSGFFGPVQEEEEYAIETDDEDQGAVAKPNPQATPQRDEGNDEFFEADPGTISNPALHQHVVEVDFKVDTLRATLSKSAPDGTDKLLGDAVFQGFGLVYAMEKYVMKVDVNLKSISMHINQAGREPLEFMSSAAGPSSTDLLTVKYTRVQQTSPEYQQVYEGIDQNVDVKISTFLFRAAPEPVLTLYDFIMTTFVPQTAGAAEAPPTPPPNTPGGEAPEVVVGAGGSPEKIRVLLTLASIQVILINDDVRIATLSLSTAYVAILLRANTMRINGRLGSLALNDDSPIQTASPDFKQILSIEGDNFADFTYQTFDPEDHATYTGVKSSISLNTGSLKVHYLEHSLHDAYLFFMRLAKLKGLYDAATEAAVQRASEIERMQFNVSISTPIVVFPADAQHSLDVLTLRLGSLKARNAYHDDSDRITAGLHGIQLTSCLHYDDVPSVLKIVDDIDIDADVTQVGNIDRSTDLDRPSNQVSVKISDVRLHLTQPQYCLLIALSQSIPKVFADVSVADYESPPSQSPEPADTQAVVLSGSTPTVDLRPELAPKVIADGSRPWTSLDLVVTVNTVKLHLYDASATTQANIKDHGIARFALNDNSLRLKTLSDGALEAQVVMKSMTMNNTRPGHSKFNEIMPAAQHERNQIMLLFTMSGGDDSNGLAVLTVDSPEVIFAVDPIISLLEFFTSAFQTQASEPGEEAVVDPEQSEPSPSGSKIDFRLDLHDVSISVLEDDSNAESQAIRLAIKQLLVSQQGVFAVSVKQVGMSLTRMGKPAESVRFLDDVDLTFTLDSRSSAAHQSTSIEVTALPIVFRASYRDIMLITTIVNKAIELYGNSTKQPEHNGAEGEKALSRPALQSTRKVSRPTTSRAQPVGHARVVTSKEQASAFRGSFEGFRLVLIGDLHEQPLLHLKVKPFILGAKDWSGELQATSTLSVHVSYWNLSNSHWEPLIDPWTFTTSVSKESPSGGTRMSINANQRLDVNLTMTFVELALATSRMLGAEGERVLQKARGSYAPYRIWNRTGYPLFIWSDTDGSHNVNETTAKQVANGKTIDWRFDDWKTMREHVSSSGHNSIGLQIVGKQWEHLRSIPVDREGEYTFSLRPRSEKYAHRLVCEVKVLGNVKQVVLRSTYKIENHTLYPLELTLVDETGQPVYAVEKIVPGQDYALPLDAVNRCRVRLQPDQGFGYKWSPAVRWEDLIAKRGFTLRCPHSDPNEAAFRFQAWADADANDIATRKLPRITLKLRAPIELENLLPYNIEYRIYDKETDQNWRSYLRKGGVMPVHSVELGHLVLLNVHAQDTAFKPSDFAIINTDGNSDFDVENKLVLRDPAGRKLDLRLNYVHYPDSGGSFKVQVYSPYIVLNKTGLPFSVRPSKSRVGSPLEVAGETRPEVLAKPVPFMLSHPVDNGKEFAFKVGDSAWSQPVSFDAPTAETRLVIPHQTQRTDEIHVGLSWTEGLGKYKLTKVITLTPRFILKNSFSQPLAFREHGVAPRGRATIEPGEKRSLHFLRVGEEKLLTFAVPGLNAQWSSPINVEDIGTVHFRLYAPEGSHHMWLMRAEVKIEGPTIFVFLNEATEGWPFTIENDSDYSFAFCQTDQARKEVGQVAKPAPTYNVASKSSLDYAWDYPAARDKRIVLSINGSRREVDIMEIGDLVPFKFAGERGTRAVSLDVRADGHRQILRITNYIAEYSLYKPRRRDTASLTRQDSISSSQEAFEAVQETVSPVLTVALDLQGIGVSLVNRRMVEVVYLSMNALKFEYTNNPVAQSVTLSCGSVQIDNQLHDALFPVVLQPTPISQDAKVAALPTVQASMIWLNDQEHGVFFVKYCSILLQALTVEADEDFLFAVYDLTKIKGASWDEGQEDVLLEYPEDIPEPQASARGQDLYFEVLELQPIKLSISFMRTERVSGEEKLSLRNPFAVVLNAVTMAVGNINDAPLEMNALAIKDMRLTLPDLQERIMHHYRQEVLRQLYRILGAADFIGNPVGLFTNVSSGVADIFYEPFNGVVMHGNKELGIGIAKGAASFVKKTVFGVSDSFTKFTSSVGKGLSATTFDSEYQLRRRMNQRRNRPRHAIYGVTAGAEALATSLVSGVEGVLLKPIEGAESEGAKGFFKGVGKGLIGAVTKPVIGVLDLASNVSEGIRNTTTVFDNPARDRVRLPRLVPADGVLVPYSEREALGQYWMKDLEEGRYRNETYVAHLNLPGGDNVILLTTTKVLSFWSNKLRLEWELPFTQVQGVTIEDTGIKFAHKAGKEQDKFIFIPDKKSQTWFFSQVASVVKAFNARRRMDS